uniref:40S ribosomal protein SA n=1 Tax=Myotis lucifugus TaxID=59463 RepID=G1Q2V7_MYOLU
MSRALKILHMKEEDVFKFLAAGTLGGTNLDFQMDQFNHKRKSNGIYIINLKRTWEKLLAARAIVATENPADVSHMVQAYWPRAVLKFAAATGATAIAGRLTPGTFTSQIQAAIWELRLLVTDSGAAHQLLTGAVNLPTTALCNTDSPLPVDIAIPCNNKGAHSMQWILAQEGLHQCGTISSEHWEVIPDVYFDRAPEETESKEQTTAVLQGGTSGLAPKFTAAQPEVADWCEGMPVPSVSIRQFPTDAWRAQSVPEDWSAPTAQATEWVGINKIEIR